VVRKIKCVCQPKSSGMGPPLCTFLKGAFGSSLGGVSSRCLFWQTSYLDIKVLAQVEFGKLHPALRTSHVAHSIEELRLRATTFLGLIVAKRLLAEIHASYRGSF